MKFYEDKTYIKMCEKAVEFIRPYTPSEGDFFAFRSIPLNAPPSELEITIWTNPEGEELEYYKSCELFCIYRQDQLQDMIKLIDLREFDEGTPFDILRYGLLIHRQENNYFEQFTTYEQLWLAFVMNKLHNKTWDNEKEDWV